MGWFVRRSRLLASTFLGGGGCLLRDPRQRGWPLRCSWYSCSQPTCTGCATRGDCEDGGGKSCEASRTLQRGGGKTSAEIWSCFEGRRGLQNWSMMIGLLGVDKIRYIVISCYFCDPQLLKIVGITSQTVSLHHSFAGSVKEEEFRLQLREKDVQVERLREELRQKEHHMSELSRHKSLFDSHQSSVEIYRSEFERKMFDKEKELDRLREELKLKDQEIQKLQEGFTKVKEIHHYAISDSCDTSELRHRIRDLVRQVDHLHFERDLWWRNRHWSSQASASPVLVTEVPILSPVTTVMPKTTVTTVESTPMSSDPEKVQVTAVVPASMPATTTTMVPATTIVPATTVVPATTMVPATTVVPAPTTVHTLTPSLVPPVLTVSSPITAHYPNGYARGPYFGEPVRYINPSRLVRYASSPWSMRLMVKTLAIGHFHNTPSNGDVTRCIVYMGGGFQHVSSSCEINPNDQISRWVLKPPTMKIWSIMVDHEMSIPLLKEEGPYLESWRWKYEFCRSSWILNLNMILTTWGAFYGVLEGTKAMTSGKMPSTPKVGSYYQSEDGVMQASARVNALIWIVDAAQCYNLEDLWSNWIAHFHTLGSFKNMN